MLNRVSVKLGLLQNDPFADSGRSAALPRVRGKVCEVSRVTGQTKTHGTKRRKWIRNEKNGQRSIGRRRKPETLKLNTSLAFVFIY